MKCSSDPDRAPSRRRNRLEVAIIVNQLATPGLGSWVAGHRLAGAGQLALSCTGFALFVAFFVRLVAASWQALDLGAPVTYPPAEIWQRALLLFGIAWVWSGWTSYRMWRELRRKIPPASDPPPILGDPT